MNRLTTPRRAPRTDAPFARSAIRHSVSRAAACLALCLGAAACSSPPARFYSLVPLAEKPSLPARADTAGSLVGLSTVHIPDIVDRPQFVTSVSEYERRIDEYARWAEPLASHITGVLAENLATLLAPRPVLVEPGRDGRDAAMMLRIEILHFDARVGGDAVLTAQWSLTGPTDTTTVFAEAAGTWSSPMRGDDPSLLAEAMSNNLLQMSHALAEAITHQPTP